MAHMEGRRHAYKVWVLTHQGKGPLRRPTCRWEDNMKMDLQEMG